MCKTVINKTDDEWLLLLSSKSSSDVFKFSYINLLDLLLLLNQLNNPGVLETDTSPDEVRKPLLKPALATVLMMGDGLIDFSLDSSTSLLNV